MRNEQETLLEHFSNMSICTWAKHLCGAFYVVGLLYSTIMVSYGFGLW